MSPIPVIVLRTCAVQGRLVHPGQRCDVSPLEAVQLVTARQVALASTSAAKRSAHAALPSPDAKDAEAPAPRRKPRTYRRRDLQAES